MSSTNDKSREGPYTVERHESSMSLAWTVVGPTDPHEWFRSEESAQFERKRLNAAYAAGRADRWISVKDRLPEGGEDVLVLTKWGGRDIAQRDWQQGWKPDHWSKDGSRIYEVEDVTHWQPLPAPLTVTPIDR